MKTLGVTSLVSDNPAATEAISLNGELAVLRFRKTKRFGVFRNFRVISMRFAVLYEQEVILKSI